MKTRFVGVVSAFAAIVVVFATVVFAIAAMEDYQENKGRSFIERAGSIVGIGTLREVDDVGQVKIEATDSASSADAPDILRFFLESEGAENLLDDLFDLEGMNRDYEYRFEDRIDRLPSLRRIEGEKRLPFDGFDFEGPWRGDWIDDLVELGLMTEEDADEFRSWFDDLPNEFDKRGPHFSGDRDFEFDGDDGRFRFRWRWDSSGDDWFFENRPKYDKGRKNGV